MECFPGLAFRSKVVKMSFHFRSFSFLGCVPTSTLSKSYHHTQEISCLIPFFPLHVSLHVPKSPILPVQVVFEKQRIPPLQKTPSERGIPSPEEEEEEEKRLSKISSKPSLFHHDHSFRLCIAGFLNGVRQTPGVSATKQQTANPSQVG